MERYEMDALIKEAVNDSILNPEQIPSIDLYLDQITNLMSEKAKEGSPRFHDRVLTKTMINNYSTDGLISPVKGKKYSKKQILQMLLVNEMKNTLSIGEIKRILQNIYALPDFEDSTLEQIYLRYLDIKDSEKTETSTFVSDFMEQNDLDPKNDGDFFILLLGLSAMSAYLKNVVQALLENRYPDLHAEKEREEQLRKEEIKRQKKEEKKAAKAAKKEDNNGASEATQTGGVST